MLAGHEIESTLAIEPGSDPETALQLEPVVVLRTSGPLVLSAVAKQVVVAVHEIEVTSVTPLGTPVALDQGPPKDVA